MTAMNSKGVRPLPTANKEIDPMDVERFLSSNMEFLKEWVMKNIGRSMLEAWVTEKQMAMTAAEVVNTSRGAGPEITVSVQKEQDGRTTSIFEQFLRGTHKRSAVQRKTRDEFMKMSQKDMFMELIRDIASELDINVLCHKILMNVSVLINADRGSLFLARGTKDSKYLVSKLFDVTEHSQMEECLHTEENHISVPFGRGIAGTVALHKKPINIKDAYQDSRFNKEIDKKTGYITKHILSMPILDFEGEVIGVAQTVNKLSDDESGFTLEDELVFKDYLTFAGIGLANAQMFELSVGELKQNQLLLALAKGIFAEQSSLEKLVQRIMLDAQDLIKCERCCVYLVNWFSSHQEVEFSKSFQMSADNPDNIIIPSYQDLKQARSAAFARSVAQSGQVMMIADAVSDPKYQQEIDDYDGFRIKSLLSVPVFDGKQQVIGVVQMMNKANGKPFTDPDISSVETFAIFCGLGVHNCQLNETVGKFTARHKVTTEVLTYHAMASQLDVLQLMSTQLAPADAYRLYSFDFVDFFLDSNGTCEIILKIFMETNTLDKFEISLETMCNWIMTVRKNYRPCYYYNWRHAVSVCQSMFAILRTGRISQLLDDLEIFALLIACVCVSIDRIGITNGALIKKQSPLITLYNGSYIEHHQFDRFLMILATEGCNIFAKLTSDNYHKAVRIIEQAILATDMSVLIKKKKLFTNAMANGEKHWQDSFNRDLLRCMIMGAAEVSVVCKPWVAQDRLEQWVMTKSIEDMDQRPYEENTPVVMKSGNAQTKEEMSKTHIDFMETICIPIYELMAKLDLNMMQMLNNARTNRAHWKALTESTQMKVQSKSFKDKTNKQFNAFDANAYASEMDDVNKKGEIIELTRDMEDDNNVDLMQYDDMPISNKNTNNEYRVTSLTSDKGASRRRLSIKKPRL